MVGAIEREPAQAKVPASRWVPIGFALQHLPLRLVAKTVIGQVRRSSLEPPQRALAAAYGELHRGVPPALRQQPTSVRLCLLILRLSKSGLGTGCR
jgi:hypothetical protein